jgi:hypothetical protein
MAYCGYVHRPVFLNIILPKTLRLEEEIQGVV